jgi:hypothetical protein
MFLSIEERVFLVEYVFREDNRYTDLVQQLLAETFPETPVPYRNAVQTLTEKFRETGSVLDAERSGRPLKLNDKKLMDVSDCLLWNPQKSLHRLAQEKEIRTATAHKAVREKLNLFPYKPHHFQHLLQVKGKAIPLQAWAGPEGSRKLRLPDFKTIGT